MFTLTFPELNDVTPCEMGENGIELFDAAYGLYDMLEDSYKSDGLQYGQVIDSVSRATRRNEYEGTAIVCGVNRGVWQETHIKWSLK